MNWIVFDPRTGDDVYHVPFRWLAILVCGWHPELDYEHV